MNLQKDWVVALFIFSFDNHVELELDQVRFILTFDIYALLRWILTVK